LGYLLDTDVVIHLRDGDDRVWEMLRELDPPFAISAMTRIEFESGVYHVAAIQKSRRAALDKILEVLITLDFTAAEISSFQDILAATSYSRRKTSDRMTAATALVHDLQLVTMNGRDFRDISGLKLVEWESP
jgi:tRNA(fMet)-specific endonuclease VapC